MSTLTGRRIFSISQLGKSVIDQHSAFTKDMAQQFLRQHLELTPTPSTATFYLDRIRFDPKGIRYELFYSDINQFFKCDEKPGIFMLYVINADTDRHTFESYQCRDHEEMMEVHALVSAAMTNKHQQLRGADRVAEDQSTGTSRRSRSPSRYTDKSGDVRVVRVTPHAPRAYSESRYRSRRSLNEPSYEYPNEQVPIAAHKKVPVVKSNNMVLYQASPTKSIEHQSYVRPTSMMVLSPQRERSDLPFLQKNANAVETEQLYFGRVPAPFNKSMVLEQTPRQSRHRTKESVQLVPAPAPMMQDLETRTMAEVYQAPPMQLVAKSKSGSRKSRKLSEEPIFVEPQRLRTYPFQLERNLIVTPLPTEVVQIRPKKTRTKVRPLSSMPEVHDFAPDNNQLVRLYKRNTLGTTINHSDSTHPQIRSTKPEYMQPSFHNGALSPQRTPKEMLSAPTSRRIVTQSPVYITPSQSVKTASFIETKFVPVETTGAAYYLQPTSVLRRAPHTTVRSYRSNSNWKHESVPNVSIVYEDKKRSVSSRSSSVENLRSPFAIRAPTYTAEATIPVGFGNLSSSKQALEETISVEQQQKSPTEYGKASFSGDPISAAKKANTIHLSPHAAGGPVIDMDGPVYMYAERSRHKSPRENSL